MREEFKRSVGGALLLLRNDRQALAHFNLSFEGFWRSFIAAALAFPFELGLTLLRTERFAQAESSLGFLLFEMFGYALGWIVFPVLAIFTTRLFDLQARYVAYVVIGNWVHSVQIVAVSSLLLIFGFEITAGSFWLFIIIVILVYDWLATRIALDTTAGVATGLVILNAAVMLLVQGLLVAM